MNAQLWLEEDPNVKDFYSIEVRRLPASVNSVIDITTCERGVLMIYGTLEKLEDFINRCSQAIRDAKATPVMTTLEEAGAAELARLRAGIVELTALDAREPGWEPPTEIESPTMMGKPLEDEMRKYGITIDYDDPNDAPILDSAIRSMTENPPDRSVERAQQDFLERTPPTREPNDTPTPVVKPNDGIRDLERAPHRGAFEHGRYVHPEDDGGGGR